MSEGKTIVFVIIEGELKGAIALADIIREESKDAIKEFKNMGVQYMMITGDRKRSCRMGILKKLDLINIMQEFYHKKKQKNSRNSI